MSSALLFGLCFSRRLRLLRLLIEMSSFFASVSRLIDFLSCLIHRRPACHLSLKITHSIQCQMEEIKKLHSQIYFFMLNENCYFERLQSAKIRETGENSKYLLGWNFVIDSCRDIWKFLWRAVIEECVALEVRGFVKKASFIDNDPRKAFSPPRSRNLIATSQYFRRCISCRNVAGKAGSSSSRRARYLRAN